MSSNLGWSVLLAISSSACCFGEVSAGGTIDLNQLPPAAREYCHIVKFPHGWRAGRIFNYPFPVIDYRYWDYEFRVEGLLNITFLVDVFSTDLGQRHDSTNRYRLNLADPAAPIATDRRADWNAAAVVPLIRKSLFYDSTHPRDELTFNGLRFKKSGAAWAGDDARQSPDSAWLVLLSMTEVKAPPLDAYNVFFDVFNADTGRKVFTIDGTYAGIGPPDGHLRQAAWLTERFFIIPLGVHRERCIVCDFAVRRKTGGQP